MLPQIVQLMRTDSYSRFLKSDLYKDHLMREMEGHSLSLPNAASTATTQEDVKKKVRFSLFHFSVATIITLIILLLFFVQYLCVSYHQPSSLLVSGVGHVIFNVCGDVEACCAHRGKRDAEESA